MKIPFPTYTGCFTSRSGFVTSVPRRITQDTISQPVPLQISPAYTDASPPVPALSPSVSSLKQAPRRINQNTISQPVQQKRRRLLTVQAPVSQTVPSTTPSCHS